MSEAILRVEGEVQRPLRLTYEDLSNIPEQIDVSREVPNRTGDAVLLDGILIMAGVKPSANFLTLHASRDGFYASIPLVPIRHKAMIVYRRDGKPLAADVDGPFRLLIPEFDTCQTTDIDECANVKHVDQLTLTVIKGLDNRPTDEAEHAELHKRQVTS